MDNTITRRNVLPPGNNESVTYGILWIRLGDLKLFKHSNTSQNISVLFWGETVPVVLQAANSVHPEHNRRAEYDVRTPILFFQKYLEDMKALSKITVETVGTVKLDLRPFLLNITERSKQVFEHFKGHFEIMNKDKSAGTLEIEMGCNFNPEVYALDIEENQDESCCCECHEESDEECACECHEKNLNKAVNILAVKQPWKLQEFVEKTEKIKESLIKDPRIPNSLNTEMPRDSAFEPNRYKDQIKPPPSQPPSRRQSKEQVDKSEILSPSSPYRQPKQQQRQERSPISQHVGDSILEKEEVRWRQDGGKKEQFPEFQKILTYSNLRLEKELRNNVDEDELKKEFYENGYRQESPILPKENRERVIYDEVREDREEPHSIDVTPTPINERKSQIAGNSSEVERNLPSEVIRPLNLTPFNMQEQNLSHFENSERGGYPAQPIHNPRMQPFNPNPNPFPIPCSQPHPPPNRMLNTTNLLLNLYCQIGSIKLDTPVLFHLIYKIYGDSVRNRIQYKGDTLTIISPVGSQQLKLMDKLPYIIEIRNTRDKEKLIGVVKISLEKIKSAYLLNGVINERVIKANMMPIIIFQGQSPVTELKGDVRGKADINLLLGTGEQISNYMNQEKKESKKKRESQNVLEEQMEYTRKLDNKVNIPQLLVSFLHHLHTHNTKIADSLLKLMNQKQLDLQNYKLFLQQINKIEYIPLFNVFDYKRKGSFPTKILTDSFQDFNTLHTKLEGEYEARNSIWKRVVNKGLLDVLHKNSEFGLIKKESFRRVLEEYTNIGEREMVEVMKLSAEDFFSIDELKGEGKDKRGEYLKYSPALYGQAVSETIQELMLDADIEPGRLLKEFNQSMEVLGVGEINKVFKVLPNSISLFSIILLISYVKSRNRVDNSESLSVGTTEFSHWVLSLEESIRKQKYRREQQVREEIEFREREQNKSNSNQGKEEEISYRQSEEKRNISGEKEQPFNPPITVNITSSPEQDLQSQFKQTIQVPKSPQQHTEEISHLPIDPVPRPKSPTPTPKLEQPHNQLLSHEFTIEGIEISFNNSVAGECSISYKFPQEEELVRSKTFFTYSDKQKYPVRLLGKHVINLNIPIENYLGENILKIDLMLNGKLLCAGGMPCSELIQDEAKTIGLFSSKEDEPTLLGKLKLRIKYKKEKAKVGQLGQTISKQMYLPKVGYVNFEISSALEKNKLAQQFKLKDDYFLSMNVDLFHLSPELSSSYKPISSRIEPTIEDIIYLRDSCKLRLTENIIEYMKTSTLRINLIAITYKHQSVAKRRVEIVVGTIDIPMLSIISGNGVHGDYAFKSKFGIFVGLARCDINYSKTKTDFVDSKKMNPQLAQKQKVYVIVNLLELLNLGEPLKWVSFECSQYGFQSTSRNYLPGNRVINYLQPNFFLLQIDDMYEMSHILVTVKSSLMSNLHFEINTRPLINSLTKHRHTVFSNYFTVVAGDVQPIRIGAKVYAFRGNQLSRTLANHIKSNPQINVFQFLEIPKQLDNYPKMVDILRKQLEMDKGGFDEIMNYILEPKERLNIELFTSQILFRLDFLQLSSDYPIDYGVFAEQPSVLAIEELQELLEYNAVEIQGMKGRQTLDKFSFRNLDMQRIDRNVELYSLEDKVDVLVCLRKIMVPEEEGESGSHLQDHSSHNVPRKYRLILGVEKGKNLQTLYNGIKPNAIVRCTTLNIETSVAARESNPQFNQQFQLELTPDDLQRIKNLHFQIQHKTSLEESSLTKVVIGRGTLNISPPTLIANKHSSLMYSIPISSNNSGYKSGKKPEIIIKIRVEKVEEISVEHEQRSQLDSNNLNGNSYMNSYYRSTMKRESVDLNRIAQIIDEEPSRRNAYAFQESEESDNSYSLY